MPFTLTMPKLSPTMEEGTLVKWHKKEGDFIASGDVIIEVATDKATVEHSALDEGWLRKILVQEGQEAIVNQPLAVLTAKKEESIEGYKPEGVERKEPAKAQPEEAKPAETQGEKAPAPAATPSKGLSLPAVSAEPPLEDYEYDRPTESIGDRVMASPLAKRLAKEKGLNLTTIKGTGPSGRIMSRDLEKAQPAGKVTFGSREKPKHKPGAYELEKLSPMRKVISQRLQEAKTFIPHFYITQGIDVEPLVAIREQLRNVDVKLTYNDFVVRACALALREHSNVNSGFDTVTNALIKFQTIDISVAVSTPTGLITPIIRHADYKNLGEISVEVRTLAAKAKEGKLAPHEYKGGSFTISNLGMYNVTEFIPIINPPQAAILAIGGIQNVPVVRNNAVVPGKVMNLTLSADHRVIDGVAGAEFMKTVQKYLENPASLIV